MKHNKLFTIVLLNCILILNLPSNSFAQTTYVGDVNLVTQTELNNFGAMNYTTIDGRLNISEAISGDITDLSPLLSIETLTYSLQVTGNDALISLNGLNNIASVGGDLEIRSNSLLQNLDGLSGVLSVSNDLDIKTNNSLVDLDGLIGITSVGDDLRISGNTNLNNLNGLNSIIFLGGYLDIENNPALDNINGLSGITSIPGFLDIEDNILITNLDALINITSVGGSLNIDGNFKLANLNGLSKISSVGLGLLVRNNSELNSFCGLFTLLNGNGLGGTYNVGNNLTNPTEAEIIAGGACDPLPVELTTFSASINKHSVELNWETATEVNNYGFEIEKQFQESSIKNQDTSTKLNNGWEKVGFVHGHGNSNSPKYYSYSDKSINLSGRYLYRLKQIDIDGSYEYSDEVEVNFGTPTDFELSQNYPNPFNPTTTISYQIPDQVRNDKPDVTLSGAQESLVQLKIYDVLGKEVATLVNEVQSPGNYKAEFDASSLNSGIYFYKIEAGNFSQVRKMMLLK